LLAHVYYRRPEQHRSVSKAELDLILSDPVGKGGKRSVEPRAARKETWAFAIGKFLTDPIWWFYLFWLPRYLQSTFGLSLSAKPAAAGDGLQHFDCGQHWRRMDFLCAAQSRQERQCRRARLPC
jgi:hypothetical protein